MEGTNSGLTIEQKIELMTLASKLDLSLGNTSASLERTLKNYEALIKKINEANS